MEIVREARLSLAKKNANKKAWFKKRANELKGTVKNGSFVPLIICAAVNMSD